MRIIVFSDSHGDTYRMIKTVEMHPEAKQIIFLGDGEYDIGQIEAYFKDRSFIKVKGNCDFASSLPAYEIRMVNGKKIYITHGYAEGVKYSLDNLIYRALEMKADIVLYGHTHCAESFYEDGMHIMNPGSIRDGYYGIIDITPDGIMINCTRVMD
ncbi:MAG: YfcE family phosphodiesterase [Clostridia bacterium]|nr:YfcE family phosphodiesterase [Clostridia bacterium]